jgi:hypothetical protein
MPNDMTKHMMLRKLAPKENQKLGNQDLGLKDAHSSRSSFIIQQRASLSLVLNLILHNCKKTQILKITSVGWLKTFFSIVSLLRICHNIQGCARNNTKAEGIQPNWKGSDETKQNLPGTSCTSADD